ncbi:MAG: hypothetical protein Kow00133_18620 [Amphiplicatus sp.]
MNKISVFLGIAAFSFATSGGKALAEEEVQNPESSQICRSEDFTGCCSWNEGVHDMRTGLCGSGAISKKCDARWNTSLKGRCSYNEGVARVDINGIVYCNNERAPGEPIPKCNDSKDSSN